MVFIQLLYWLLFIEQILYSLILTDQVFLKFDDKDAWCQYGMKHFCAPHNITCWFKLCAVCHTRGVRDYCKCLLHNSWECLQFLPTLIWTLYLKFPWGVGGMHPEKFNYKSICGEHKLCYFTSCTNASVEKKPLRFLEPLIGISINIALQ